MGVPYQAWDRGKKKNHEQSYFSRVDAHPKTRSLTSSKVREPSRLSAGLYLCSRQAQAIVLECVRTRALTSWESRAGRKLSRALLGTSLLSPVRPED